MRCLEEIDSHLQERCSNWVKLVTDELRPNHGSSTGERTPRFVFVKPSENLVSTAFYLGTALLDASDGHCAVIIEGAVPHNKSVDRITLLAKVFNSTSGDYIPA